MARRIVVKGPLLQQKALKFVYCHSRQTMGGLNHFSKPIFGTMSVERGDVNNELVSDWKAKLPENYL